MSYYILPHGLSGEHQRLARMSALLDPMELACISRLGISAGWGCLELGCGDGSIAKELAQRVAPAGHVVASDNDLTYVANLQAPCLEVRRIDILHDAIEDGPYDLVLARALLHHLTPARIVLDRMVKALKPGGVLLSIEPDMLPCTVAEPESMRSFWQQWLAWSAQSGIDYFIGRKIPAWFDSLRLTDLTSEGHTAQFNGGSNWAIYWMETMQVLTQLCSNLDDSRRKRWKNSSSATKIRTTGQVSSPL
jgi:SAM-dependent methyltransferase